ncbi:hypothetical protein VTK56DRAFT_4508 [Thermocarpiscus australiensis]
MPRFARTSFPDRSVSPRLMMVGITADGTTTEWSVVTQCAPKSVVSTRGCVPVRTRTHAKELRSDDVPVHPRPSMGHMSTGHPISTVQVVLSHAWPTGRIFELLLCYHGEYDQIWVKQHKPENEDSVINSQDLSKRLTFWRDVEGQQASLGRLATAENRYDILTSSLSLGQGTTSCQKNRLKKGNQQTGIPQWPDLGSLGLVSSWSEYSLASL